MYNSVVFEFRVQVGITQHSDMAQLCQWLQIQSMENQTLQYCKGFKLLACIEQRKQQKDITLINNIGSRTLQRIIKTWKESGELSS